MTYRPTETDERGNPVLWKHFCDICNEEITRKMSGPKHIAVAKNLSLNVILMKESNLAFEAMDACEACVMKALREAVMAVENA